MFYYSCAHHRVDVENPVASSVGCIRIAIIIIFKLHSAKLVEIKVKFLENVLQPQAVLNVIHHFECNYFFNILSVLSPFNTFSQFLFSLTFLCVILLFFCRKENNYCICNKRTKNTMFNNSKNVTTITYFAKKHNIFAQTK